MVTYDPADTNKDGKVSDAEASVAFLRTLGNQQETNLPTISTGTNVGTSITPKETAANQLNSTLMGLLGRRATAKEISLYLSGLNSLEKTYASRSSSYGKSGVSTATANTSTGSDTSTNYLFNASDFLVTYVESIANKTIKAGKPLGGTAGASYNTLMKYAGDMGLSTADVLTNTIKIAKGDVDLISIQGGMRKRAITLYGSFADQFKADPTLTLRDASQDYMNTMSELLDLPVNSIKLNDPTLSKALQAVDGNGKPRMMTTNEFSNLLRDDNRFQYSSTAHKEATDMASSFASAMGFGA